MGRYLAKENWNIFQIRAELDALEYLYRDIWQIYNYDVEGGFPIDHPGWDWDTAQEYPRYAKLRQRYEKLVEERRYA